MLKQYEEIINTLEFISKTTTDKRLKIQVKAEISQINKYIKELK
jgi:hypothetical protein